MLQTLDQNHPASSFSHPYHPCYTYPNNPIDFFFHSLIRVAVVVAVFHHKRNFAEFPLPSSLSFVPLRVVPSTAVTFALTLAFTPCVDTLTFAATVASFANPFAAPYHHSVVTPTGNVYVACPSNPESSASHSTSQTCRNKNAPALPGS